jgi:hypothetical protein
MTDVKDTDIQQLNHREGFHDYSNKHNYINKINPYCGLESSVKVFYTIVAYALNLLNSCIWPIRPEEPKDNRPHP